MTLLCPGCKAPLRKASSAEVIRAIPFLWDCRLINLYDEGEIDYHEEEDGYLVICGGCGWFEWLEYHPSGWPEWYAQMRSIIKGRVK